MDGVARVLVAVAVQSLSAAPVEITLSQYQALAVLARRGPQRPSDLADQLEVGPSSVSRLSDRLVRKGLIVRQGVAADRREVRLVLTAQGQASVAVVTGARRREIERVVATIPPSGQDVLVTCLRAFSSAAGDAPELAWSYGWTPLAGPGPSR